MNPHNYLPFTDPFGGSMKLYAVPALRADVALIHAQRGDVYGNLQYFGATYFDQLLARSASTVIATVDEIVDTEVIRREPAPDQGSGDARHRDRPAAAGGAAVRQPFPLPARS